jgi:hypothetical protein
MNLRFIVRDGKKILQRGWNTPGCEIQWEDVPCVEDKPKSVEVTREKIAISIDRVGYNFNPKGEGFQQYLEMLYEELGL